MEGGHNGLRWYSIVLLFLWSFVGIFFLACSIVILQDLVVFCFWVCLFAFVFQFGKFQCGILVFFCVFLHFFYCFFLCPSPDGHRLLVFCLFFGNSLLCYLMWCLSLDTATTVSDSEAKGHGRRPRRRTTGGSDVEKDLERAKRLQQQGQSSEHDTQAAQTLSRQQIISMVKKRFGLRADEVGANKANGVQEDTVVS